MTPPPPDFMVSSTFVSWHLVAKKSFPLPLIYLGIPSLSHLSPRVLKTSSSHSCLQFRVRPAVLGPASPPVCPAITPLPQVRTLSPVPAGPLLSCCPSAGPGPRQPLPHVAVRLLLSFLTLIFLAAPGLSCDPGDPVP